MRILYLIPARGGSKGLPGKNIKQLGGKRLIAYTIDVAKQNLQPETDVICISTDSAEIAGIVQHMGIDLPFLRPPVLASDISETYDVILHAIDFYEQHGREFDAVMLLQPTSPFRTVKHLKDIICLMECTPQAEMVVSVKKSKENPYFNLFEENQDGYIQKSKPGNYGRRQDCPEVYAYNGSVYLMKTDALKSKSLHSFEKIIKYEMEEEYSIDIDTMKDWVMAEYILSQKPDLLQ